MVTGSCSVDFSFILFYSNAYTAMVARNIGIDTIQNTF